MPNRVLNNNSKKSMEPTRDWLRRKLQKGWYLH